MALLVVERRRHCPSFGMPYLAPHRQYLAPVGERECGFAPSSFLARELTLGQQKRLKKKLDCLRTSLVVVDVVR